MSDYTVAKIDKEDKRHEASSNVPKQMWMICWDRLKRSQHWPPKNVITPAMSRKARKLWVQREYFLLEEMQRP